MFGRQKNPRVSIMIEPDLDEHYISAAGKAVGQITERLKASGFRIIGLSNDNKIQMGLHVGLSLEFSAKSTVVRDSERSVNEIRLGANIYRAGEKGILATVSAVEKQPG